MTTPTATYFCIAVHADKHATPETRLARAIDQAAMRPGVARPMVVMVNAAVAARTTAPEGVELRGASFVLPGDYRFLLEAS